MFIVFENMKEHFLLSSNFEEMVDELGHRMEEILTRKISYHIKKKVRMAIGRVS